MTQTSFIELTVELKEDEGFTVGDVVAFVQRVTEVDIELANGVHVIVPDDKIDGLSWKVVDTSGETKIRASDFIANRFSHTD